MKFQLFLGDEEIKDIVISRVLVNLQAGHQITVTFENQPDVSQFKQGDNVTLLLWSNVSINGISIVCNLFEINPQYMLCDL